MILDLHMPVMDGVELLRLIRKEKNNIPVIIYTADITSEKKELLEELQIKYIMYKPIDIPAFTQLIDTYIHHSGKISPWSPSEKTENL